MAPPKNKMRTLKTPSPKTAKRSSWAKAPVNGTSVPANAVASLADAIVEPLADWAFYTVAIAMRFKCLSESELEASVHVLAVYPLCCRVWRDHSRLHRHSHLPMMSYAFFVQAHAHAKVHEQGCNPVPSWSLRRIPPAFITLGETCMWFSEWFASAGKNERSISTQRGESQHEWIKRRTLDKKDDLLKGNISWLGLIRQLHTAMIDRIERRPKRLQTLVLLPNLHPSLPWEAKLWLTVVRCVQHVMMSDATLTMALSSRCCARSCRQPMWRINEGCGNVQTIWRERDGRASGGYWGCLGVRYVRSSTDPTSKIKYCCESCCAATVRSYHAELIVRPDDHLDVDDELPDSLSPRSRVVHAFDACLKRNRRFERRRSAKESGGEIGNDIANRRKESIVALNVDLVMLAVAATRVGMASYARVAIGMPGGQRAWRSNPLYTGRQKIASRAAGIEIDPPEESLVSWQGYIMRNVPCTHVVTSRAECDACIRETKRAIASDTIV